MPNVLFLCARNRLRSPTAEALFANWPDLTTDSAGVSPDADVPVTSEHLEWADTIFVMESTHARKLNRMFGHLLKSKRVVCLDIADDYSFMQPELIELLKQKVVPHLS